MDGHITDQGPAIYCENDVPYVFGHAVNNSIFHCKLPVVVGVDSTIDSRKSAMLKYNLEGGGGGLMRINSLGRSYSHNLLTSEVWPLRL